MIKTLIILIAGFALSSCGGVLNKTYVYPEDLSSYRKVEYGYTLTIDSTTKRLYRDTSFVDTIVPFQGSPHINYQFKLNKTCIYSFMGNGSDSGPIYWQYKGKYQNRNDSIVINFYEFRSIRYDLVHYNKMKIEDRKWKEMEFESTTTLITNNKCDTLWEIQSSGFKGTFLIKK
jgi:hypothetical protein